jgi:hypothetical protein
MRSEELIGHNVKLCISQEDRAVYFPPVNRSSYSQQAPSQSAAPPKVPQNFSSSPKLGLDLGSPELAIPYPHPFPRIHPQLDRKGLHQ